VRADLDPVPRARAHVGRASAVGDRDARQAGGPRVLDLDRGGGAAPRDGARREGTLERGRCMIPATANHTAALFDGIAPVYDRVNTVVSMGTDRFWRARVRKALPPGDALCVLDVATGTGEIAFELLRSPRVAEVVGVDPAAQMLAMAERKAKTIPRGGDVRFQQMDAIALELDDASFDVVAVAVAGHVTTDPTAALRELRRVL